MMKIFIYFFMVFAFSANASCPDNLSEPWKFNQNNNPKDYSAKQYPAEVGFWYFTTDQYCLNYKEPQSFWQFYHFSNFDFSGRKKSDSPNRDILIIKLADVCATNGIFKPKYGDPRFIRALLHALFEGGYLAPSEMQFNKCN